MWNNIRNIVSIPDMNINIKKEKKKTIQKQTCKVIRKILGYYYLLFIDR